MTPRCTVPSRNPCRHPPDYWIGVEGVAYLACAVHRTALTREGAWVETEWAAPLDGPAPHFAGRPRSNEVIPDEPAPIPKRIGRPKTDRPVARVNVAPEPPKLPRKGAIIGVELDPEARVGMCRNVHCPGKGQREAKAHGLCKSCGQRAHALSILAAVSAPWPAKPTGLPPSLMVEVDPSRPEGMCRNVYCRGGGTRKARSRGLCAPCGGAAVRLGVYAQVAAPARCGGKLLPLVPCRRCGEDCRGVLGYCKKCYDRANHKAINRGLRMADVSADVLHALTEITNPSCIRRKVGVGKGGEATNGN